MAINLAGADKYFDKANHVRASEWEGFRDTREDQLEGALAQATRQIARFMDDEPEEPADPADITAFPREDYAVYEQALWIMANSSLVSNADQTAPAALATDPEEPDDVRRAQRNVYSPEAIRWLIRSGQVFLSRG